MCHPLYKNVLSHLQVFCSNGQVGFGKRKKRTVSDEGASEQQRVYEVSMSTIVKVGDETIDTVVRTSKGDQKETFVSEEGKYFFDMPFATPPGNLVFF